MNWILKWYLRRVLAKPVLRAIQWTAEERNAFDLFCRTSCGIKLFEFLRQIVVTQTLQAVYHDKVSANARARGMQEMLALLHRLRVFPLSEESLDAELEETEQSEPLGTNASQSDRWRWMGGSGAIG